MLPLKPTQQTSLCSQVQPVTLQRYLHCHGMGNTRPRPLQLLLGDLAPSSTGEHHGGIDRQLSSQMSSSAHLTQCDH